MTPISVVIITYNEEKNIARCLLSIKEIADEIVIVDSFSSDNTVDIAKSFGAKIILHEFEGHIQQKNFAITQSKYSHILSLDADEMPDDELLVEIKRVKSNWDADGYSFNRLNNYCGKWIRHGAWYPDIKLRLWDSSKGSWNGLNPHDRFVMKPDSEIKHLKGNLLHYSYSTIQQHREKIEYFSTIAADAYFKNGKRSSNYKIVISPVFRFIRDYFIKLGIFDGVYGLIIAYYTALEVRSKYKKLKLKQI